MNSKEWWLFYDEDKDRGDDWFTDNLKKVIANHRKNGIRVIEFSAYEKLQKEHEIMWDALNWISQMSPDMAETQSTWEAADALKKIIPLETDREEK